jgi:hypothetical protein
MRAKRKTLRLEALLLLIIGFTLFNGCSIEKPSPPSWDTQWRLPLVNKSYSVLDIIEEIDQEGLTYDSLGNPEIYVNQDIDTLEVGDNLTSPGYHRRLLETLGTLEIESPAPQLVSLDLDDLSPGWPGGPLPPFHFSTSEPLAEFGEYSYATVEAGMIYVEIYNSLGLDLDTLTLQLVDDYDSQILGTIEAGGGLPNGETVNDSLSLAGKTIHNQFSLVMEGHSPGGDLGPGDQSLQIAVSFSDSFTVSQAEAKIPEFTKIHSEQVTSDDSSVIATAVIESGQLSLAIENQTNLEAEVYLSCPNILYHGDSLLVTRFLSPHESAQVYSSLGGYQIQPSGEEFPQSIVVNLRAEVPGSGEEKRLFDQNDSVAVSFDISDCTFSEVNGRLKPTVVESDPQTEQLDLPEGLEDMHLTAAELHLTFHNGAAFPADLNLVISGDNGKQLDLSGRIQARTAPQVPRTTTIVKGEEEVSDFLNPFPEEITVTGQAIFNPDYAEGYLTSEDFIYGEIEIRSPLAFAILDTAEMEMDIEEVDGDWEEADRLRSGDVTAELENHLPVGAEVTLYIGQVGDDRIYDHPGTVVVGPLSIAAGQTSQLGLTTAASHNSFQEGLSRQELEVFDNEVIYVAKRIILFPTVLEEGVSIQSSDYLRVQATAALSVEVGGED